MVLQVLADPGQISDNGDSMLLEQGRGPDARHLQELGRLEGPGCEDDFFVRAQGEGSSVCLHLDSGGGFILVENNTFGERQVEDGEVFPGQHGLQECGCGGLAMSRHRIDGQGHPGAAHEAAVQERLSFGYADGVHGFLDPRGPGLGISRICDIQRAAGSCVRFVVDGCSVGESSVLGGAEIHALQVKLSHRLVLVRLIADYVGPLVESPFNRMRVVHVIQIRGTAKLDMAKSVLVITTWRRRYVRIFRVRNEQLGFQLPIIFMSKQCQDLSKIATPTLRREIVSYSLWRGRKPPIRCRVRLI